MSTGRSIDPKWLRLIPVTRLFFHSVRYGPDKRQASHSALGYALDPQCEGIFLLFGSFRAVLGDLLCWGLDMSCPSQPMSDPLM